MKEPKKTERLELRWVRVVDARGRERLEARWVDRSAHLTVAHHAA